MLLDRGGDGTARSWLRGGRRVVSALLVDVEGSAPLPSGSRLLVDELGHVEGAITGGCVESAVVHEARAVLGDESTPRLLRFGESDELGGVPGLTCGGTVHVLVYALDGSARAAELAALDAAAAGRPAAIATAVDGPLAGAQLAVAGGEVIGSLGGSPRLDDTVVRDAEGQLAAGRSALRRYGEAETALGCSLRVHIRAFSTPPRMLLFGATDFSAALAPIASEVGYQVTICDPRATFARAPRYARAAEVLVCWPAEAIAGRRLGPRDAVVVLSHDPKFDEPAITAALATDVGYLGALGSRRTTADRARRLMRSGVLPEQLARIAAPCGLDVGAATPAEVAVSILGEILARRSGRRGGPLTHAAGPIHERAVA
jgi:xanthine dehydrogenase accessory factor